MPDYDWQNAKTYKVLRTGIKPPSSNWSEIECPFCKTTVRAYWWSISGGGKKCIRPGCKTMFNSAGMAAQEIKKGKPK